MCKSTALVKFDTREIILLYNTFLNHWKPDNKCEKVLFIKLFLWKDIFIIAHGEACKMALCPAIPCKTIQI